MQFAPTHLIIKSSSPQNLHPIDQDQLKMAESFSFFKKVIALFVALMFSMLMLGDGSKPALPAQEIINTYSISNFSNLKWWDLNFENRKYPIIYNKEHITINFKINTLTYFKPIFSPERKQINPSKPLMTYQNNQTSIRFDFPGEYYLNLNNIYFIKIIVLDRNDCISNNVIRIFDFLAANLIVAQGNDKEFYANNKIFTRTFFLSKSPKMLLCGPTLSLFEIILNDRFNLPVRDVTFTGVYIESGTLKYATHNVLEIYLPDLKKWVLFDINNGFIAKWLNAFEITEITRKASKSKINISKHEFDQIKFNEHYFVDPKETKNWQDSRTIFNPNMIGTASVREHWHNLGKLFLSGPSYWGGRRFNQDGLSEKYQLYISRYHKNRLLLDAQIEWQKKWNINAIHISPSNLKHLLNKAYSKEIAAQKWEQNLPKPINLNE